MSSREISKSSIARIESLIFTVRGERIILDTDLAKIYGVTTKRLNEHVKRNIEKFPSDFAFQLTNNEFANLKSQNATSRSQSVTLNKIYFQIATALNNTKSASNSALFHLRFFSTLG